MSPTSIVDRPAISVVATLYRSAPYLEEFHARTVATLRQLGFDDYEIVFVNDGSPDNSCDVVIGLSARDPRVVVVDLSRNFGHHKAIMTGLAHARGKLVYLLDCDLEEDPELLVQLHARLQEAKCDVVYGVQAARRGTILSRISGEIHYKLMNAVSGMNFPLNILTLRLMTRRYVDSLLQHQERELLISGIWHLTGYEQIPLAVTKHDTSPTTYSVISRFKLVLMGVISFSDRPLRWIFYTGFGVLFFAFLYILYILGVDLLNDGVGVSGYTSLILSIWIIGGLNFLFLGTIGVYIATIFSETKQRPYTIVRAIYREGREHGVSKNKL
jgi:putative glycosyltransferase